jgi:hypothetical protein
MRIYHIDGTLPKNGEIFVFGSNTEGWHGWGAAKAAADKFGAIRYQSVGLMGQSYAIPTKRFDSRIRRLVRLTREQIKLNILLFCSFTRAHPDMRFFVTSVACGLAGYGYDEIAPFFKEAINCSFPEDWDVYLEDLE